MNKSVISAIACSVLGASISLATPLTTGWGLYGFNSDVNMTQTYTSSSGVKIVWKYSNNQWYAYSPDSSVNLQLDNLSQNRFELLSMGEGVWIYSDGTTDTSTGQSGAVDTRSLASILVSGAESLNEVGVASGMSTQNSSYIGMQFPNYYNYTSNTGLARILDGDYSPSGSFQLSDSKMILDMNGSLGSTNENAIISFFINSVEQNASQLVDYNGEAYGIKYDDPNGLKEVVTYLGGQFTSLGSGGNADFPSMVTKVNTLKQYPLFSLIGNQTFKDFFNSFPDSQSTAQVADWNTIASNFVDLNFTDTYSPYIDFGKIEYKINFNAPNSISMGSTTVQLPQLVSSNLNLGEMLLNSYSTSSEQNMTVNFKGETDGMITLSGITLAMKNIDLNVTVSKYSTNDIKIIGKYDISQEIDGKQITGTATFNENGCQGADIYADGVFFSRVKLDMTDGKLYLVDESNNKIDTNPLN